MEIIGRLIMAALVLGIYVTIAKYVWRIWEKEKFVFVLWIIFGMPISMYFAELVMIIIVYLLLPIWILLFAE